MTTGGWPDFSYIDRAILLLAALLVPSRDRPEWLAEWKSELAYILRRDARDLHNSDREALWFCLGAFKDSMWLRRNTPASNPGKLHWLQSPIRCVVFLAVVAAAAIFFFFRSPGPGGAIVRAAQVHPEFAFVHFLMIGIAILILPVTTSLGLGEYPATRTSPARARRFRRGVFLGVKFALILPVVFCGAIDLGPLISATGLQPHATLTGYVLAFRWALIDQRRRCPVCLRLLTSPVRIGQASQTFLEWYGTELFCPKGHGLLHVPEVPNTYNTQSWLDLDSSWGSLFS